MGSRRISNRRAHRAASAVLAGLCATSLLLAAARGMAEDARPAPAPAPADGGGFLAAVGRWLHEQAAQFHSNTKDVRSDVEHLGRDAGGVAKSTIEGAKDAAGAIIRIPATRVVSGHAECALAANGAPDCGAAADRICKDKGFSSGKSIEMTTAEVCPPEVYLAGRRSGPECRTETTVARAICQ